MCRHERKNNGGGGRESNPPGSFRPLIGFEDRDVHQARSRLHERAYRSNPRYVAAGAVCALNAKKSLSFWSAYATAKVAIASAKTSPDPI
jgi:hypothetical protein